MTEKIQETYNSLHDFEAKTKNWKGKKQLYPIHKKLQFPEGKYNDISDWIIDHLKIKKGDVILDAGCGVGYVLVKICKNFNCNGLGISLSEKEITYATKVCREMGLEKQISFEQKSFDDGFNKKFDVIIAIESIKHSESIQGTIKNLITHLKPGGRIFILDDFITNIRIKYFENQVKKHWAVKTFFSVNSVEKKLNELKMHYEITDFTDYVTYTKERFTNAKLLLTFPLIFLAKLIPYFNIYSIFFAGFCLERLYKKRPWNTKR